TVLGERGQQSLFARDPDFFTPERVAAVEHEYSAMARALCETQRGSGKRFIVSNWEGDNQVYACASIGRYVECKQAEREGKPETSECCEVRRACDDRTKVCAGSERPRVLTVSEAVENYRLWVDAR